MVNYCIFNFRSALKIYKNHSCYFSRDTLQSPFLLRMDHWKIHKISLAPTFSLRVMGNKRIGKPQNHVCASPPQTAVLRSRRWANFGAAFHAVEILPSAQIGGHPRILDVDGTDWRWFIGRAANSCEQGVKCVRWPLSLSHSLTPSRELLRRASEMYWTRREQVRSGAGCLFYSESVEGVVGIQLQPLQPPTPHSVSSLTNSMYLMCDPINARRICEILPPKPTPIYQDYGNNSVNAPPQFHAERAELNCCTAIW